MNVFGVIGGLGPQATSKFYLELTKRFVDKFDYYPQIIIDNVSFPRELEEEIIQKSRNEQKMLPFLIRSIKKLNKGGADFIVMPCNTLHIFIEKLRKESRVPILNIVDETIKGIKDRKYKKIGLLATSKTVNSGLFNNGFQFILPDKKEQDELSKIEVRILRNQVTEKDVHSMEKMIKKLIERGSEAVVLACTDLQLIIKQKDFDVEIIDTLEILIDSSFQKMIRGES